MKRRTGFWHEVERERFEAGMTQREFAEHLGVTQGYYSKCLDECPERRLHLACRVLRHYPRLATPFLRQVIGLQNVLVLEDYVSSTEAVNDTKTLAVR